MQFLSACGRQKEEISGEIASLGANAGWLSIAEPLPLGLPDVGAGQQTARSGRSPAAKGVGAARERSCSACDRLLDRQADHL
jgi:hypothetical protein